MNMVADCRWRESKESLEVECYGKLDQVEIHGGSDGRRSESLWSVGESPPAERTLKAKRPLCQK
jgi:hypothetical protein